MTSFTIKTSPVCLSLKSNKVHQYSFYSTINYSNLNLRQMAFAEKENNCVSSQKSGRILKALIINRRHNVYYLLINSLALLFPLNKWTGATKLMHASTLAIKKRSQIVTQPGHINT